MGVGTVDKGSFIHSPLLLLLLIRIQYVYVLNVCLFVKSESPGESQYIESMDTVQTTVH